MARKKRQRSKTSQPCSKKNKKGRHRPNVKAVKINQHNGYNLGATSFKNEFVKMSPPSYARKSVRGKKNDDPSDGIHCRGALANYNGNFAEVNFSNALRDGLPKLITRLQQKKAAAATNSGQQFTELDAKILDLALKSSILGKRYPRSAYDSYLELTDGSGATSFYGIAQQTRMAHRSSQRNSWNYDCRIKVQQSVAKQNQIVAALTNLGIFIGSGNDLEKASETQQELGDVEGESDEKMEEVSDEEMSEVGEEVALLELEESGSDSGGGEGVQMEAEDAADEGLEEEEGAELLEDEELAEAEDGSDLGYVDFLAALSDGLVTLNDNMDEVLCSIFKMIINNEISPLEQSPEDVEAGVQAPHGFVTDTQRAGASTLEYGCSIVQSRMPACSNVTPSFIEGAQKLTLCVQPPPGYKFNNLNLPDLVCLGGLGSAEQIVKELASLIDLLPSFCESALEVLAHYNDPMNGRMVFKAILDCCDKLESLCQGAVDKAAHKIWDGTALDVALNPGAEPVCLTPEGQVETLGILLRDPIAAQNTAHVVVVRVYPGGSFNLLDVVGGDKRGFIQVGNFLRRAGNSVLILVGEKCEKPVAVYLVSAAALTTRLPALLSENRIRSGDLPALLKDFSVHLEDPALDLELFESTIFAPPADVKIASMAQLMFSRLVCAMFLLILKGKKLNFGAEGLFKDSMSLTGLKRITETCLGLYEALESLIQLDVTSVHNLFHALRKIRAALPIDTLKSAAGANLKTENRSKTEVELALDAWQAELARHGAGPFPGYTSILRGKKEDLDLFRDILDLYFPPAVMVACQAAISKGVTWKKMASRWHNGANKGWRYNPDWMDAEKMQMIEIDFTEARKRGERFSQGHKNSKNKRILQAAAATETDITPQGRLRKIPSRFL